MLYNIKQPENLRVQKKNNTFVKFFRVKYSKIIL